MSIFNTLNTNSAHIEDIKSAMASIIAELSMSAAGIKETKDALDAEREADASGREQTLRRMARLSMVSSWSAKDVETGVGDAVAALSTKNGPKLPGSIKTFTDECKAVMLPGLREHFADIMDAATTVWAAETEARKDDKDAHAPARKAWKRRYHTITMCARALPEHGLLLDTPELVTQYAVFKDPDMDAGKVYKQIETALEALEVIKKNFPDLNVASAAMSLAGVTKDTLERARASALDAAAQAAAPRETASTTVTSPVASTTVVDEVLPTPTPVSAALTILGGTSAPIAGAFDPLAHLTTVPSPFASRAAA